MSMIAEKYGAARLRLVFGLLAAFAIWAWLANTGQLLDFDTAGLLLFRTDGDLSVTVGPKWLVSLGLGITHMGGTVALVGLSLLLVAAVWRRAGTGRALAYFLSVGLGLALVALLKALFHRARPDVVEHLMHETSLSFPSGHATRSAIVYLTIALFLSELRPEWRRGIYLLASLIFVAVGVSRVFLGVHWPSDIVGGWLVALTWLALWRPWLVLNQR
ncbi:MAG: phosphatase PAP2 family protein [Alphaproteobacteria bacterium]|nr:MAG: phosphatase PAP2 family protein [Alphaproteobacteria bacterium]